MNSEMARFQSWTDADVAMLCIGRSLQIFSEDVDAVHDVKPLLWSNNMESRCLSEILKAMVKAGYLEYDEDAVAYRFSPQFCPIQSGNHGRPIAPD